MSFALDGYLARIRLTEAPAATAEGLAAVQRAHRLAIPFENLDVRLGRGIRIDGASVFAKLVTAKRGGYCFEHNRLFGYALAALGFAARPLLGRVWLGDPAEPPPLTHTLSLVTIDGQEWIADAGFGGSYGPPMPLIAGSEAATPDGTRFRLSEDERGWVLARNGNAATTDGRSARDGWVDQYSFTLDMVDDAALEEANTLTSTTPGLRMVDHVVVSIVLPNGFASLVDRNYRRHASGEDSAVEIADRRVYRLRLSMMFGIDLTRDDVGGLDLFD